MNRKAQMITIFFSLFLILAVITIIGIESANLQTNQNINSLQQAYNLPKLEYYSFLNTISKITTINPSNYTNAIFNSTIQNIYNSLFQNLNITEEGVNTASLVINNFAEIIPLLITNSQNFATPNPFQQMINLSLSPISNYLSTTPFGQNVEFTYLNGSVIPSWLESYNSKYAVWWVKIQSIPAKGTMTIYMKFAGKSTNLFNLKTTGEAPTLSPTYGEYDDGANVFLNYWNFAGTILSSGWTGSGYTINNGVSLPFSSYAITTATYGLNAGQILDFYGNFPLATSANNAGFGYTLSSSAVTSSSSIQTWFEINNGVWTNDYAGGLVDQGSAWTATSALATGYNVYSVYWPSSSKASFYVNYGSSSTLTTNIYGSQLPIGGANTQGSQATIGPFYWARVRAYPPNSVMPSVQILNPPPQIGYIVPVTITNNQNSATSNPFQQELLVNSSRYGILESPNLQNIEFFYTNGTIIPSWLESGNRSSQNTVYWLKIGSIPANSSINVYMGFASPNTNLFNGKTVGEAPQLSTVYDQYNNIGNVMSPGLLYQIYYNSSLTCDSTNYQTQLYTAEMGNNVIVSGCDYFASSTTPFTTSLQGTSQDVDGTTEPNVVINYQAGYSGGAAYPNPPVSNTGTSWLLKAIGWVNIPQFTTSTFSEISDDGITLSSGTDIGGSNGAAWLGGVVSPNNLISEWHLEGATTYQSNSVNAGVYRLELDYFEDGGGSYTGLWSSGTVDYYHAAYPPNGVMPSTSVGTIQNYPAISPFYYQYSVANFTNASSISVPGTASTGTIWNGGHAYTLTMWVNMQHSYGACGYPCVDLFQTNQGCTSGLEQQADNATGYQINLLEWNASCGTGATAQGSPYQYVPYNKWELITGIFKYNSQGNAWIASCVDTHCTNSSWTLDTPAVYSTPATILGSGQMNGEVADVQMYNSALTLNRVKQLANGFIGAPPVNNSTLVAWLPFDGNPYDYSGNKNTASLTSINFVYP